MALQSSGAISFNNINVELGVAGTTSASLNQSSYRTLAGVASGAISMSNFYGKSNAPAGGTISVSMVWNFSYGYGDNPEQATTSYTNYSPDPGGSIYGHALKGIYSSYSWSYSGGITTVTLQENDLPKNTFTSITGAGTGTLYTANATHANAAGGGTLWQWSGEPVLYVPSYGQSSYGTVSFSYT